MYIYDRRLLGPQFPWHRVRPNTFVTSRRYGLFPCKSHVAFRRRPFALGVIEGLGDIKPEDIAAEMVGSSFTVSAPFSSVLVTLAGGETVKAVSWSNTSSDAGVRKILLPFDIPKRLLRPVAPTVAAIAPYSAGTEAQAKAVEKGERDIAFWQAKAPTFRTAKAKALFGKELRRLKGLQQTRERTLNRKLIQETMFNRFDQLIDKWTTFYNSKFGFTGANALDPNWIKSMFFQESEMGTAGRHMIDPPSGPLSRKTRFNLGQVIDSSGPALLIMIEEMEPALVTTHLQDLRKDLDAAIKERKRLQKLSRRSSVERARLIELDRLSKRSWETFIWEYKAIGQPTGFSDAVAAFFASVPAGQQHRNLDYEFWIRTAIRWLFEKHKGRSWKEAVRAYNGIGPRAERYRDAVLKRARLAVDAQKKGKSFIPARR